jgi:hypothetical protein
MNWPPPPISPDADATQEWVVTSSGGLITKIEAIDRATQQRTDVSVYSGLSGSNAGQTEESVVTTNNLLITKIEKIDRATQRRTELSREEYAGLVAAMGLAAYAYYAGIRDYALALAVGDTNSAQTYYKTMTDYFAGIGQS